MQRLTVGLIEDVENEINDYLDRGWVVIHMKLPAGSERVARKSNTILAVVLQKDTK